MDQHAAKASGSASRAMPSVYTSRPRVEEVADRVYRIDLCVPKVLGSTNSYLIKADGRRDSGRSLLVDVGTSQPVTRKTFDAALRAVGVSWDSVDVFLTHSHWDHCAGLVQVWRPGMTVYGGVSSFGDRPAPIMSARALGVIEREVSARHSIDGDPIDRDYWAPMADEAQGDFPITVVHEGDEIAVGGYRLRVLETFGHGPDHRCLYDVRRRLFFSGDQVLYSLYPSIALETDADQFADFMATTKRLRALDASLVPCGHGVEGRDLARRCQEMIDHYDRQLAGFLPLCTPDVTDPGELAYLSTKRPRRLSWEERPLFGRIALLAQTMAYLRHLVWTGRLPDVYKITPLGW